MDYTQFRAMNSDIVLAAEGDPQKVERGFRDARAYIEQSEQRFTRFSDQSELSMLNRSAGRWFKPSPDLFEVIRLTQQYVDLTDGLFDPSILPDLRRIGYDRSMDEIRLNGVNHLWAESLREDLSIKTLLLDDETGLVWMPPGMQIDLGGIAKGWIAEQAAWLLGEQTSACAVNAGGDLFMVGLPEGQKEWEIGLEDPRDPSQDLATLHVKSGAVATSSIMKRAWTQGERQQHHLIDPRSGEPAVTDWLSVTVIAAQAAAAEVYAKVLLIAGPDQSNDILASDGGVAFIAVDRQGKLWGSKNSQEFINGHSNGNN
jgi:thiamine biosynthesis lipoprotein